MKVLLINSPILATFPDKEYPLPESMLYLGTELTKHNIETKVLDLSILRHWESPLGEEVIQQKLEKEMTNYSPDLVGISCMASNQFSMTRKIMKWIKNISQETPILFGGMHATIYYKEILANVKEVDYIALGEGEGQLLELAQGKDPNEIDGLIIRKEQLFTSRRSAITTLDCKPDYSLFDFSDYHHNLKHWHSPKKLEFNMMIPILSSRACPKNCNFCSSFIVMGRGFRPRSAENVVDEIEYLHKVHGLNRFAFQDDNLTLNKKRALDIMNGIISRGLNIEFETPNGIMVSSIDEELADAMVGAGLVRVMLSVESGSDYIRNKIMGKNLTTEKIHQVNTYFKKYPHVRRKAALVFGMPEDTPETLMETYNLMKSLELHEVYAGNATPFPGTRFFSQALKDNLLTESIDINNLWMGDSFTDRYDTDYFYVKPYNMTLQELKKYRKLFDEMPESSYQIANDRKRKGLLNVSKQ